MKQKTIRRKILVSSLPIMLLELHTAFLQNKKWVYIYKVETDLSPYLIREIETYKKLGYKYETVLLFTGNTLGGFNNEKK